jgi:hypothetical protein
MTATAHERAEALLPWLVNGSLQGNDFAWLQSHLTECAQCRDERYRQQLVRDAVARQPVVEPAPQASFRRLWQRIESQAQVPEDAIAVPVLATLRDRWQWRRVTGLAAGLAAALALVSLMLWQNQAAFTGNRYRTVSSESPAVQREQIRVVFADTATVADIRGILATGHLEATGGPTPAGVFTLQLAASTADRDVGATVQSLRADPRVRFAELR